MKHGLFVNMGKLSVKTYDREVPHLGDMGLKY